MIISVSTDIPLSAPVDVAEGIVDVAETKLRRRVEQQGELGNLGRAMLRNRSRETGVMQKKLGDLTEPERALVVAMTIDRGIRIDGKQVEDFRFITRDKDGRAITDDNGKLQQEGLLPTQINGVTEDNGTPFVPDGPVCFSRIVKMEADGPNKGKYVCEFAYTDTGELVTVGVDDQGNPLTLQMHVSTDEMLDAQAVAENTHLAQLFAGEPQAAFTAYTQSRSHTSPDSELPDGIDATMETMATEMGIPTAKGVAELIAKKYPEGEERPPAVTALLDQLTSEGRAVMVDENEFLAAMSALGIGKDQLGERIASLQRERTAATTERQTAIEQEIALLQKAQKAWEQAEAQGTDPLKVCYQSALRGEFDLVKAMKDNDMMALLGQLPDFQNLSEEERKLMLLDLDKLKTGSLATLKWGGIGLLVIAALLAAGVLVAGVGGVAMAGASARQ